MYQAVSDASPPPVPSPSNQLTTGLSIFTRSSSMSVSSDKSSRGPEASPRGDHLGIIRFDKNPYYHFVCGLHYTLLMYTHTSSHFSLSSHQLITHPHLTFTSPSPSPSFPIIQAINTPPRSIQALVYFLPIHHRHHRPLYRLHHHPSAV